MKIAVLLDTIYHLPVYERMLIVEHTIRSIRTGKNGYTVFTEPDVLQTHRASEQVLAKEWLNETEDEAWKTL